MKIEEIDRNFATAKIGNRDVRYYDVTDAPISLEGFPWGDPKKGEFFRLPPTLKAPDDINDGALFNGLHYASGGCARFRTNANFIAVRAILRDSCDMNHMPRCGSAGFDIYVGPSAESHHVGSAQPNRDEKNLERVLIDFGEWKGETREFRVNFPLYGGVGKVEIGLPPDATLEAPAPHAVKPILFYGSSITQGGCASRPGNNYCSMLCRAVDAEQINLGFSGCGRGEPAVARAIASLDLGAFVMDYDHNAPDPDHLQRTHRDFFSIIRESHPELPVVMMSMCDIWRDRFYATRSQRRDIVRATYDWAKGRGDSNVYFIDGEELFGDFGRCECTVDTVHPNDLGFYRMFERTLPVLREALKI
jgi:hypothetical protein